METDDGGKIPVSAKGGDRNLDKTTPGTSPEQNEAKRRVGATRTGKRELRLETNMKTTHQDSLQTIRERASSGHYDPLQDFNVLYFPFSETTH